MYWSSKALPWLIPSLLLTAPSDGTIVVVSPWIEDVDLQVFRWEGSTLLEGLVSLREVLQWLHRERRIHFSFYVREDQLTPTINPRLEEVYQELRGLANFYGVSNLHAKILVTDSVVLETSANLLTNSLYKNVETIAIHSNEDKNAMIYTKHFFTRHGLLIP